MTIPRTTSMPVKMTTAMTIEMAIGATFVMPTIMDMPKAMTIVMMQVEANYHDGNNEDKQYG